jgi:hypothetical protein
MQKGADFIVVFFCCCHSDQALDRMQSNTGWGGYPVDFTAVAISQNIRSSIPIREAVDARPPILQAGFQDVTVTTIRT